MILCPSCETCNENAKTYSNSKTNDTAHCWCQPRYICSSMSSQRAWNSYAFASVLYIQHSKHIHFCISWYAHEWIICILCICRMAFCLVLVFLCALNGYCARTKSSPLSSNHYRPRDKKEKEKERESAEIMSPSRNALNACFFDFVSMVFAMNN